jgi:predicted nuclease with TOPRIM domain
LKEITRLNAQIDSYLALLEEKDADILRLKNQNVQLYSENIDLKSSKAEIEEEVVKLNIKTEDLEEKVNLASRLNAENIIVAAVNSRGRERESEFRNRQLSKLKVSFIIAENKVAAPGIRDVYLQVLSPNGQVIFDIAKGSGTFDLDGKESFYTCKQDFVFNNTKQQLTYFYEKESDYDKGIYAVKIFSEGSEMGKSTFEIK